MGNIKYMKKVLLSLFLNIIYIGLQAQTQVNRSGPAVTVKDDRLRGGLNLGMPIVNDTTLNGGLDSLGFMIYSKLYRAVFIRDTNLIGGGHKWTKQIAAGDALLSPNLQTVTTNGNWTTNKVILGDSVVQPIIGNIFTDQFNRASLGPNYTSSLASATLSFPGSAFLRVTGGNGNFGNYIEYVNATGTNKFDDSILVIPTNLTATSYGVGIGPVSNNTYYTRGIVAHFQMDNSSGKGAIIFYNQKAVSSSSVDYPVISTSVGRLAFSVNDSLIGRLIRVDNGFSATFRNRTTGAIISHSYTFPVGVPVGTLQVPNTGYRRIFFFGGNQDILLSSLNSQERKNTVIGLGNSIQTQYSATAIEKRYFAWLFGRNAYELSGGPGDRSPDGLLKLSEVALHFARYAIVEYGTNDIANGISAITFAANIDSICRFLIPRGTTPVLLSLLPTSAGVVPYNDSLQAIAIRYGLKYVNIYDVLRVGAVYNPNYISADGLHPNDSGHYVIAQAIRLTAPEVLANTGRLVLGNLASYPNTDANILIINSSGEVRSGPIVSSVPNTSGFTDGSIPYVSGGALVESNSTLFRGLNNNVGIGTNSLSAASMLEVVSTTQGSRPFPRMTNAQRTAIPSPPVGLFAYSTDATEGPYANFSTGWKRLLSSDDLGWSLTGNVITLGTQVLGSTNNSALKLITNNTTQLEVSPTGLFGFGITPSLHKMYVKSTTALSSASNVYIEGTSSSTGLITDFGQLQLVNLDNTTNNGSSIVIGNSVNSVTSIRSVNTTPASAFGDLTFITRSAAGMTEKMRIASTGLTTLSTTTAFGLPVGTTAQRPAGANGYFRSNTDSTYLPEYFDGTNWQALASRNWVRGLGVGGNTLYTGDGTITGVERNVTGASAASLTFNNFPYFNLKASSLRFQNSAESEEFIFFQNAASHFLQIGWTHGGIFDEEKAIEIDTNNNVRIGGYLDVHTQIRSSGDDPAIAAGAGAGTAPTVSITGTDVAGVIEVTTGTLPTLGATVATVTFNLPYGAAPYVIITPVNSATALLSGVNMVYVSGANTTTFTMTAGTTALTATTTYRWNYHIIQ